MTLREIKGRITSLKTIQKTTNVMKVISSVKMAKFRNLLEFSREPLSLVESIVNGLTSQVEDLPAIFHNVKSEKILLLALSSDRGLCSNFNHQVTKKIHKLLGDDFKDKEIELRCVGRRIAEFAERKLANKSQAQLMADTSQTTQIRELASELIVDFLNGKFGACYVLHYNFQSVMTQDLCLTQLLPCQTSTGPAKPINMDDDPVEALDFFGRELANLRLYNIFLGHLTAENCFRMKAMDSATTNTKNMIAEKELFYNRQRQALITKDLIEIISGAESQN